MIICYLRTLIIAITFTIIILYASYLNILCKKFCHFINVYGAGEDPTVALRAAQESEELLSKIRSKLSDDSALIVVGVTLEPNLVYLNDDLSFVDDTENIIKSEKLESATK